MNHLNLSMVSAEWIGNAAAFRSKQSPRSWEFLWTLRFVLLAGLVDLSNTFVSDDGGTAYFALDGIHDGEPVFGGAHVPLPARS